jgi:6-phosphogluconolactonase
MLTRFGVMAALVALTLSAGMYGEPSRAATPPVNVQTELVYVGTQQAEIRALRFDASTGELTMIGPVAVAPKSTWVTWVTAHPRLPILYAVVDDEAREGSIIAYAVDRGTGSLTKVNEIGSGGNGTANLSLDIPSMTLLAANYGSGSVSSVAVNHNGSVGALVSTITETGSGPNHRQASAHAHNAVVDPSGRYVLVPDLGADRVFVYRFDRAGHALAPDIGANRNNSRAFVAPLGSGPRHLAFGSSGRYVYLLTELTAEIMVLRWDASQGRLSLVQTVPMTSRDFAGVKSGAEIEVSRDGRFVYAENRAENALLVYHADPDSGKLSLVQRTSAGGDRPWTFAIDLSGRWLLVANQRSGRVNAFSIDPASGMVSDTGQSVEVPSPISVAFVK